MIRLYIISIAILCCAAIPVAIAGNIIKHYDEHHKLTGYTVIDGDRQAHYDRSWNRTGHTVSKENKNTHYDIDNNRIGHTEWDKYDTCLTSPGTGRDIKNKREMLQESWWFLKCGCR
jgi:hypothetical protein